MRFLTTTALAALLLGSMTLCDLVPAYADDAAPAAPSTAAPATSAPMTPDPSGGAQLHPWNGSHGWSHGGQHARFGRQGGMEAGLLRLACSDRGGEALEIALVHLQYSVKPTAAQQPLFDALKTTAIASQKSFADTCKAAMNTAAAPGKPSIVDRLQKRLAMDNAEATALGDVVPKLKAFYDSLTDEQKAQMEPHRGGMRHGFGPGNRPGMMGRHHMNGMDQMSQPPDDGPSTAPVPPSGNDTPANPDDTDSPAT